MAPYTCADETDPDQRGLHELEERAVALRLPFMDMRPRPHGGQLALHGGAVNVLANLNKIQVLLPRRLHDLQTVLLELRRSNMSVRAYRKQAIRPGRVVRAMQYLVRTPLYVQRGVELQPDWEEHVHEAVAAAVVPAALFVEQHAPVAEAADGSQEEAAPSSGNCDTFLHPFVIPPPLNGVTISVAPGEDFQPDPLRAPHAKEEMFPSVHCGFPLTPGPVPVTSKMLNRFVIRERSRRGCISAYLLYSYLQNTMEDIQQAARLKLYRAKLLHRHLSIKHVVDTTSRQQLVHEQVAFHDLAHIRGSPPYQENMRNDMLAMVELLGTPTWFTSFSANECGWSPLQHALTCLLRYPDNHAAVTADVVANLTGSQRFANIRDDPVTCVRYFDHIMAALHSALQTCPDLLGGIVDRFDVYEFQVCYLVPIAFMHPAYCKHCMEAMKTCCADRLRRHSCNMYCK